MNNLEMVMTPKVCQSQGIVGDDIDFLRITRKMTVATADSCLAGHVLRITESTFPVEVLMENVVDRLGSLSASRCHISTKFAFIASHFYVFYVIAMD
jgi:hypothetical protein